MEAKLFLLQVGIVKWLMNVLQTNTLSMYKKWK